MIDERESPGRKAVGTEHDPERSGEAEAFSSFGNGKDHIENPEVNQTDSGAWTQTELRSLRDALWEAINGIEEKAPGAPIERELIILDHLAEGLGNGMYKADADSMRRGLQQRKTKRSAVMYLKSAETAPVGRLK